MTVAVASMDEMIVGERGEIATIKGETISIRIRIGTATAHDPVALIQTIMVNSTNAMLKAIICMALVVAPKGLEAINKIAIENSRMTVVMGKTEAKTTAIKTTKDTKQKKSHNNKLLPRKISIMI